MELGFKAIVGCQRCKELDQMMEKEKLNVTQHMTSSILNKSVDSDKKNSVKVRDTIVPAIKSIKKIGTLDSQLGTVSRHEDTKSLLNQ